MKKLKGIVTAIPTLMDADLVVREDWMTQLIEFIIEGGVDGLYPCGTTGEMLYLTKEERKLIAKVVVDTKNRVKPEIVTYIHVGAAIPSDTVELALHAHSIGADGVGVVTPWYHRIDDEALYQYFDLVFSQLPKDFPLYVYNIPQLSGNDLKPETIARLKQKYANLIGVKYSYSDFNRLKEYISLDGIEVLVGPDVQMIESMLIGAKGTVSGLSSVYPEIFREMNALFNNKEYEEAVNLEVYAYKLGCIMNHGGNLSKFKAALEMRGLPKSIVKPPLRNMTNIEAEEFISTLKEWENSVRKILPLK